MRRTVNLCIFLCVFPYLCASANVDNDLGFFKLPALVGEDWLEPTITTDSPELRAWFSANHREGKRIYVELWRLNLEQQKMEETEYLKECIAQRKESSRSVDHYTTETSFTLDHTPSVAVMGYQDHDKSSPKYSIEVFSRKGSYEIFISFASNSSRPDLDTEFLSFCREIIFPQPTPRKPSS